MKFVNVRFEKFIPTGVESHGYFLSHYPVSLQIRRVFTLLIQGSQVSFYGQHHDISRHSSRTAPLTFGHGRMHFSHEKLGSLQYKSVVRESELVVMEGSLLSRTTRGCSLCSHVVADFLVL